MKKAHRRACINDNKVNLYYIVIFLTFST